MRRFWKWLPRVFAIDVNLLFLVLKDGEYLPLVVFLFNQVIFTCEDLFEIVVSSQLKIDVIFLPYFRFQQLVLAVSDFFYVLGSFFVVKRSIFLVCYASP